MFLQHIPSTILPLMVLSIHLRTLDTLAYTPGNSASAQPIPKETTPINVARPSLRMSGPWVRIDYIIA